MIVSLTMVRNEADIVESFVRHNVQFLDAMIVLDNGSCDQTPEILFSLIREGLPVYYLFDPDPCYVQDVISTALLYAAIDHFSPEFVIPLDADEFITATDGTCSKDDLANALAPVAVFLIPWITYVPGTQAILPTADPLPRMDHRRSFEPKAVYKAIVPAVIATQNEITLKQGNHDVLSPSSIERRVLSGFSLAHFPIRTVEQFRSKSLVGWLANLAKENYVLFDWYSFYCGIKLGEHIDDEHIATLAIRKDLPNEVASPELEYAPMFTTSIRRYPVQPIDAISSLLSYCEDLLTLRENPSHPLGRGQSVTKDGRRRKYGNQLAAGGLVGLIEQSGLSAFETTVIVRVARDLPADSSIGIIGSNAERLARVLAILRSQNGCTDAPRIVLLQSSDSAVAQSPASLDLIVGDISNGCFQPSEGPLLLTHVREGGIVVLLSIDRCPLTRELAETWLSPDKNWNDKALLRGTYYARRSHKVEPHV
jgi:glycosyltransferase involved in cell wall biosynthesis